MTFREKNIEREGLYKHGAVGIWQLALVTWKRIVRSEYRVEVGRRQQSI